MKKQDLSLKDISINYFERYGFINVIIKINQLTYILILSCIKNIVYFIFHVFYI